MNITTCTLPTLVLGLVLAACGQDAPTPSPGATDVATTPSPTAAPRTGSPSPSAEGSPTAGGDAPDGWRRVAVAEQGFSLAVPGEWQELSPELLGESGVMEQMREANPNAAEALDQAAAAIEGGQIALFAFDPSGTSTESGFATNLNAINVGPVEGSAEDAADEVAGAIRQQIPIIGDVETETVSLPAGDAALVRYEWEVDDGEGTVTTVTVRQYAIIADGGTGFILSMSAASEAIKGYEETFRQIAESFREEEAS
jgi:hypothetical protein